MKELISPKQVALALGVSEASLKRWCDKGLIPAIRTAGGHRRLPINGVIHFIRQTGQHLVRPEVLGSDFAGRVFWTVGGTGIRGGGISGTGSRV